jgi:hypothetical protein
MMAHNDKGLQALLEKPSLKPPEADLKKWIFLRDRAKNTQKWPEMKDPDVISKIIAEIFNEEDSRPSSFNLDGLGIGADVEQVLKQKESIDVDSTKSDLIAQEYAASEARREFARMNMDVVDDDFVEREFRWHPDPQKLENDLVTGEWKYSSDERRTAEDDVFQNHS